MSCQDAPASSESAELQCDADGIGFRLDECRVGLILALRCQRSVMHCGSPRFRCRRAIFSIGVPGVVSISCIKERPVNRVEQVCGADGLA